MLNMAHTNKIGGKTPKQWLANYEKMVDPPECENGHFGCSCTAKTGGPCMNEMSLLVEQPDDQ